DPPAVGRALWPARLSVDPEGTSGPGLRLHPARLPAGGPRDRAGRAVRPLRPRRLESRRAGAGGPVQPAEPDPRLRRRAARLRLAPVPDAAGGARRTRGRAADAGLGRGVRPLVSVRLGPG